MRRCRLPWVTIIADAVTIKRWTTRVGPVPGRGRRQESVTHRPDEASLVSRVQLKELVGVSNAQVITKALDKLKIAAVGEGAKSLDTYNNGGRGFRSFDVPYYDASVAGTIRTELQQHAEAIGGDWFRYEQTKFRWATSS